MGSLSHERADMNAHSGDKKRGKDECMLPAYVLLARRLRQQGMDTDTTGIRRTARRHNIENTLRKDQNNLVGVGESGGQTVQAPQ
jgi:hypothetical protein